MFRSVAPWAASSPRDRSRRCASTVKPPIPTRAMSSMPMVARASTIVSGFSTLPDDAECGVDTFGPILARGHAARVEQDSDLRRRGDLARDDEGELVHQALRVLHDPGDPPGRPVLAPQAAHREVEGGGHAAGHRHLARTGRVVPADQGEHGLAVRPVRVLRAQVVGVDRAGDGDGLVLDHVDPAEAVPQRGDLAGQVRVGSLERGLVLGGAESRVRRRGRVGGHGRPHDGGRDRDRDAAPGPAAAGATRGAAAARPSG